MTRIASGSYGPNVLHTDSAMSKIPFPHDSQIHEVEVRKSYFAPFESIEWLENFALGQNRLGAWKLYSRFFVCTLVRPFYSNTAVGGQPNHLPIFDSMQYQRQKELEKSQIRFKSLGSALPADVSQSLFPYTQGYKITLEGGTLF